MEVVGVEYIHPCSTCVCAQCKKGPIHPMSNHECTESNVRCTKCRDTQKYNIKSMCINLTK